MQKYDEWQSQSKCNVLGAKPEQHFDDLGVMYLSIQFRIITEYVDPNYENIYPEEITRYLDSVSWDAHLGESYFITITGDQTNGYTAALTQ